MGWGWEGRAKDQTTGSSWGQVQGDQAELAKGSELQARIMGQERGPDPGVLKLENRDPESPEEEEVGK